MRDESNGSAANVGQERNLFAKQTRLPHSDDFQPPIVSNLRLMFNYGAVRDRQMPLFARFSMHNSPLMGAAAIARERPL